MKEPLKWIGILLVLALTFTQSHGQVKIAGHRGGYYFTYPESSISLFEFLADQFEKDTLIIEIDLRKSKEGTLFLMHDETIDRTTTGSGRIADLNDTYLKSVNLRTKTGVTPHGIPTFEEALNFIRSRNINLMLDVKEPIHKEVLDLVKSHHLENRVVVLTFRREYTQLVAGNYPHVLLSALIETEEDLNFFMHLPVDTGKRIAYVNPKTPGSLISRIRTEKILIMADVSEDLRHNGKPLNAKDYKTKIQEQQLDILISDFPIEALHALRK